VEVAPDAVLAGRGKHAKGTTATKPEKEGESGSVTTGTRNYIMIRFACMHIRYQRRDNMKKQ